MQSRDGAVRAGRGKKQKKTCAPGVGDRVRDAFGPVQTGGFSLFPIWWLFIYEPFYSKFVRYDELVINVANLSSRYRLR